MSNKIENVEEIKAEEAMENTTAENTAESDTPTGKDYRFLGRDIHVEKRKKEKKAKTSDKEPGGKKIAAAIGGTILTIGAIAGGAMAVISHRNANQMDPCEDLTGLSGCSCDYAEKPAEIEPEANDLE